jgi:hypothetical protein
MKGSLGSAIVIFAYVIVLFVLVRPGSQGPTFVKNVGGGISNVVKHKVAVAVIAVYLLMSFFPQIGLMQVIGKAQGKQ